MGIIPCNSDCKYQCDGYCSLESAGQINNSAVDDGCAHYISSNSEEKQEEKENN